MVGMPVLLHRTWAVISRALCQDLPNMQSGWVDWCVLPSSGTDIVK